MNTVGNFIYHYLGLQGTGPWYAWHSGIGGFEVAVLTVLFGFYRLHRCHNAACWVGPSWFRRLGTHLTKDGHTLCHTCIALPMKDLKLVNVHPDHGGTR